MMRLLKIMLAILALGVLAAPLISCGSSSDEPELLENQIATVQRGNITLDITAAGNLDLSRTEDLAIDLFYQKGTIAEVLVEEGDTVEEEQVLAKLDMGEWEDELNKLEKALITAQRSLTSKQSALTQAERQVVTKERTVTAKESAVTEAERQVAAKELAVRQAQLNVQIAEYNLNQIEEVNEAQEAVDEAENYLKLIKMVRMGELGGGLQGDFSYWSQQEAMAEDELERAEEELEEILDATNLTVSEDVALDLARKLLLLEQEQRDLEDAQVDVEDTKQDVDDAKYALENARLDVEDAKQDVEDARLNVDDAKQDVEDAQSDLEEARSLSPEIKAPFDGFVTRVNVEGGDEVLKGTVAVQIADPNKFEADIMVSEMDILQAKLEGEAWVSVDAMQGMSLPAKVTHIAPTATIQSGVVNYVVKVEIESMEAVVQERRGAMQKAMEDIAAGQIPERLQQAIDEGRITQEQAEEMMAGGGPPEGMTPPAGMEFPAGMQGATGQEAPATSQTPSMVSEDFQLREGLTVTVTIIVDERTDVLLVPNAAITSEGRQSYVQVVTASGDTEQRAVQTGISDWQFTEITDGLSEGEQVLVPQGTVTTQTTEERRGGMMFFGGPGPR
jgi:multidrug efflux pump subunit AcrA (membrane-fusion protein)